MSTVLEYPEGEAVYSVPQTLPLQINDVVMTWDGDTETQKLWIVMRRTWFLNSDGRNDIQLVVEPSGSKAWPDQLCPSCGDSHVPTLMPSSTVGQPVWGYECSDCDVSWEAPYVEVRFGK